MNVYTRAELEASDLYDYNKGICRQIQGFLRAALSSDGRGREGK